MARAFGATAGAASTDIISLPCANGLASNRTISFHGFRNGTGDNDLGRYFDRQGATLCYLDGGSSALWIEDALTPTSGAYFLSFPTDAAWTVITIVHTVGSTPAVYYNGVSQSVVVSQAASGTPTGITTPFDIGNRTSPSSNRPLGGAVAEFGVWDRLLDANEVAALGGGMSPGCIPTNLVVYAPLIRDVVDLRGQGSAPTVSGTAVYPHPRVFEAPESAVLVPITATVTSVSGSLATTEPPDTSALAVTIANQATLASTDRPDAAALNATVANQAQLATTDRPDATAAAVTVSNGVALAATEPPDVGAAAVTVANLVQLAATEAPDVAAISAAPITVSLGATEPPDVAALNVLLAQLGSFAVTEAPDTSSFAATVANQAALATTEAPDVAAIAATVVSGPSAALATTEAPDTAALAANFNLQAALATTEAPDVAAVAAKLNVFGPLASTDRPDAASISAAFTSPPIGVLATTEAPDVAAISITAAGVFAVQVAASEPPDVVSAAAWTYPWHSTGRPGGVWTPINGTVPVWTPVPRPH
jgi:hypothetical protein